MYLSQFKIFGSLLAFLQKFLIFRFFKINQEHSLIMFIFSFIKHRLKKA